ncbi:MAG: hypothetical protein RL660_2226 [Bacteroidota bacterium]
MSSSTSFRGIILAAAICLLFSACDNLGVQGSGKATTKTFPVNNFNGVLSDLAGEVAITVDSSMPAFCSITADDNIMPLLKAEVAKEELLLTTNGSASYNAKTPITVVVHVPSLVSAKLLGSGDFNIGGNIVSKHMQLGLMGSGNMRVNNGLFEQLEANLSGSGNIYLQNCISIKADYGINGSGNIEAKGNAVKLCRANLTGSGNIHTNVADSIDAEITGNGNVYYPKGIKVGSRVTGNGQAIAQ